MKLSRFVFKEEKASLRAYDRALRYGRILGRLPFIRMVTLTGSLAVRNCDEAGDYDYMLVAKTGRDVDGARICVAAESGGAFILAKSYARI